MNHVKALIIHVLVLSSHLILPADSHALTAPLTRQHNTHYAQRQPLKNVFTASLILLSMGTLGILVTPSPSPYYQKSPASIPSTISHPTHSMISKD